MGKIIFWLVVVFVALTVLRIANAAKARRGQGTGSRPAALPMVRCGQCGVYLPRADAVPASDGFRCGGGGCHGRQ
jgi:uncharacterized protein